MSTLFDIWNTIQLNLFPWFEEILDPLTEKEKQLISVVSLLDLGKHTRTYAWGGIGRRRKSRLSLAKAFIAKSVYNFETTDILIEYLKGCKNLRRLCSWENRWSVPSKATFSRAFSEFAQRQLPEKIHEAMVKTHCGSKLAGHISRDSTAIEAREKPAKKSRNDLPKRKRGRPRKGEEVAPKPPKRLDLQPDRGLEENLAELPTQCDVGTKLNSKGHKTSWIGYKLHVDCVDGDIPVSAVLTSASVHDSQAAIPLAQMSAKRLTSLYDLMDSAYDAPQIKDFSRQLGHVPIIDHNPRRTGAKIQMDPATQARFAQRSSVERVNSTLKDNYGGSNIRVKGPQKVMTHLMFGVIVITAMQLYRLLL